MEDKTAYEIKAAEANQKIPNQKNGKGIIGLLSKKYGDRVKVITPSSFPRENRMAGPAKHRKGVLILQTPI